MFEANGTLHADAVCQTTTFQNLVYYHWFTMERTLDQMFTEAATRGGPNISTVAVLDLKGLNSSHVSSRIMDHIKGMISIDNCCYPETLGKMFVINAPWLAGMSCSTPIHTIYFLSSLYSDLHVKSHRGRS